MAQPAPDGSLKSWGAIERAHRWRALLVGNGLSVNVWEDFAYASLYKEARRVGALTGEDDALFRALDTQNFERVLGELNAAIRVASALRNDTTPLVARYQSIQAGLGEAVRAVHVRWERVPPT